MKTLHILITTLLLHFSLALCGEDSTITNPSKADEQTVIVIPVSGEVDPAMAAFIGRAIRGHSSVENPLFLLEMDTFGGRVDAALNIVDTLLTIPKGQSIAYVKKRAISAGALIALACSKLTMKNNTTIGDCAPLTMGQDGPKMLGEKFQSPLRAKFRALAKRNNYPSTLAESMVTAEITVFKIVLADTTFYVDSLGLQDMEPSLKAKIKTKKTVVKKGELLTMDDVEAQELGFSSASVDGVDDLIDKLGIAAKEIVYIEESWSEKFVGFLGSIAPLLLILGLAGVYIETKTPGVGIPGIVGLLCLVLVFGGQYMVGLANYTEMLLLLIGLLLLAAEVFVIPGFGITGIAGIAFIAIGMLLSFQDFVIPKPEMPWQKELLVKNLFMIMISVVSSVSLIVIFFIFIFPHLSKVVSGPYLSSTLANSSSSSGTTLSLSVGDNGIVVKPLRPSGMAKFDDRVYDVIADGDMIDKDESITISDINGNRITVLRSKKHG